AGRAAFFQAGNQTFCMKPLASHNSSSVWAVLRKPSIQNFLHQRPRPIDLVQSLDDGGGIDGDGAALFVVEGVVPRQTFQVAVEDDADEFAVAIDDGAAGITRSE